MQRFSTRTLALAAGLAVVAFVAPAAAQTGDGWTTRSSPTSAPAMSPPTWSQRLPTKTL